MKILTFGTFDYLHPGHLAYLRFAASKGDLHIIVARDATVRHIKGRVARQSEQERAVALRKAFPDAVITPGDPEDYLAPVEKLQPDLIVMGYDQTLPPGVSKEDLPCPIEIAPPYRPEEYKSSLRPSSESIN